MAAVFSAVELVELRINVSIDRKSLVVVLSFVMVTSMKVSPALNRTTTC